MLQLRRLYAQAASWRPGVADIVFMVATLVLFACSARGMLDDPGLGWHLRIADQMYESAGFITTEPFCVVSEGEPFVAFSWLGDILLRLAWGWSGLNGLGLITSLTLALCYRVILTRMLYDNVPWVMAVAWTSLAGLATKPFWTARPNVFSFVGLAVTVSIATRFHKGQISRTSTLWLIPLFLAWANMHGGFLGGAFVLAVTYAIECYLALLASSEIERVEARRRLRWWSAMGVVLFCTTLVNPYGYRLYLWLSRFSDSFIQESSTTEWLPTDFTAPGFGVAEALLLALPLLLGIGRQRANLLELMLSVIWLHFALGTVRYVGLWVLIVVPLLCTLSCHVPWYFLLVHWLRRETSNGFRARFRNAAPPIRYRVSLIFALLVFFSSRWLPTVSGHHADNMPTAALDYLLATCGGERVFHSANWGGYLTWHGWDSEPRFRTWMDDRIDVHGQENTEEYYRLMRAEPGWQELLDVRQIDVVCLPTDAKLAYELVQLATWQEVYRDAKVVVFRRTTDTATSRTPRHYLRRVQWHQPVDANPTNLGRRLAARGDSLHRRQGRKLGIESPRSLRTAGICSDRGMVTVR